MRHVALLVLCTNLAMAPALAQGPGERVRLVGLTFDHWRGASGPALLRPTLRLTTYSRGGPGAEFALGTCPDGISIHPPGVVVGLQAGLAHPVHAGPVTFLLKAGGAGIAVAGILPDSRLFRLFPGLQAGLGLLLPVDRKTTLRLDVTRHRYSDWRGGWSFGVGFSGGLRRGR